MGPVRTPCTSGQAEWQLANPQSTPQHPPNALLDASRHHDQLGDLYTSPLVPFGDPEAPDWVPASTSDISPPPVPHATHSGGLSQLAATQPLFYTHWDYARGIW